MATKTKKTGTKSAGAKKKSGALAALKRHPIRATLGVAAAVGVGAMLFGKKKSGAAAKAKGRRTAKK